MQRVTVYVDFIGGRFQAFYYARANGATQTRRFDRYDRSEAIAAAIRDSGYPKRDCRIVTVH